MSDAGYTQPTPVQAQAIPVVLNGGDAVVGAQTGTGKTASFALPVLQLLSAKPSTRPHVRTLILTPTRELAAQVEQSIRTYGRHLRVKSTTVFGGVNINPQVNALRRGVDILVATPGRLLDHVRSRTVDLSKVEIFILDEADRMLDMGFIPDIRRILETLPKQRQNLFFSATFSREIRQFADSFLNAPTEVAVQRRKETGELIKQVVHPVDKGNKRALLSYLIGSGDWKQVLVFTRTKHGANRLAEQLGKDGISASAIHGNKSQGARTKALADFKRGAVRTLVATDIAARGLDIKELPHVVNFELPNVPEDYVHRIGRTGRAGSNGVALSLVCREEKPLLSSIEKLTRNRIESVTVSGFEPGAAFTEDDDTETDARRSNSRPGNRGAKRADSNKSPSRKPGARSGQPAKRRERGAQAAAGDSGSRGPRNARGEQPANPASAKRRKRRRSNKANATGGTMRSQEAAAAPGRIRSALRTVASMFGDSRRSR